MNLRVAPRASAGSLLIVTLWIVTILGALSVAVARYLSTEVRLTRYRLARSEARELARSGVVFAQQLLQQDPAPEPQTVSPSAGRRMTVTITDEERKLNVNTATPAQLSVLLGDDALAQAIADYADAKHGPIAVLEELNALEDLDETARDLLAAHTTPHTGAAQNGGPLNINTATQPAMLALGLSEYTVSMIDGVRSRPNGRFEQPGGILPTLQGLGWTIADAEQSLKEQTLLNAMTTSSSVFMVVSEGVVDQPPVRVRIQAVLQRSTNSATLNIMAWSER